MIGLVLALSLAAAFVLCSEEQVCDVTQRVGDERAEKEYERWTDGVPAEEAAAVAVEMSDDRRKEDAIG